MPSYPGHSHDAVITSSTKASAEELLAVPQSIEPLTIEGEHVSGNLRTHLHATLHSTMPLYPLFNLSSLGFL